jgi:hypothetical protein
MMEDRGSMPNKNLKRKKYSLMKMDKEELTLSGAVQSK